MQAGAIMIQLYFYFAEQIGVTLTSFSLEHCRRIIANLVTK